MAVLKCKMCGGDLVIEPDVTVCECEYCGTKQTVPNADDEKKIKLYERANRLRLRSEFDKAGGIYENLIEEYPEEAEAYWGNLLCKYGIEYVDDPVTGEKVPTCHRSSFDSFMDDPDFDMVMENADSVARSVYREQSKQIEEIRKGIIEVSGKEQPYDIFICYKETDDNGERTLDSVLAQDVYEVLTEKGYRVFFSRISLEDKLGTEYEPYIFAALNSAKIMLAIGTSYDNYNAVWVKNEWSRFLKLMAKDKKKYLIPCYKDIDAYDMPKEFSKLQAQDMEKVGAQQDLIRGIDKLTGKDMISHIATPGQTIIQQISTGGPNAESLIDRGNMLLEEGAFEEAKEYYNRALDIDSSSAEAYLGLFMTDIRVTNHESAKNAFIFGDYANNRYLKHAKQKASDSLLEELQGWESEKDNFQEGVDKEIGKYRKEIDLLQEEKVTIESEIEIIQKDFSSKIFEISEEEQDYIDILKSDSENARQDVKNAEIFSETCQEKQDIVRFEEEISTKRWELNKLGIFRGKEKRIVQSQIEDLEEKIDRAKRVVEENENELTKLKKISDKKDAEYDGYLKTIAEKRKAYKREIKADLTKKTTPLKSRISQIEKHILKIESNINYLRMKKTLVGGTLFFGKEIGKVKNIPIEWYVIKRNEKELMIVSKNVLEERNYHETDKNVSWEKSALRSWLNGDFINSYFSKDERKMIEDTKCEADQNPQFSAELGNVSVDKVFLLSIREVEEYMQSVSLRCCKASYNLTLDYYKKYGKEISSSLGWHLRTPGRWTQWGNALTYVKADGTINYEGALYRPPISVSVRPAMWISLDK